MDYQRKILMLGNEYKNILLLFFDEGLIKE